MKKAIERTSRVQHWLVAVLALWREWHIVSADCFAWLLVVHVVASALHLLDVLRD